MRILLAHVQSHNFLTDLCQSGFEIKSATINGEILDLMGQSCLAAILLGHYQGHFCALSMLRKLRHINVKTPVVVLSHVHDAQVGAQCLNEGADAYFESPFSGQLILAQVKALLRRHQNCEVRPKLHVGGFTVDRLKREVFLNDRRLKIHRSWFPIFLKLAEQSGKTVTREDIKEVMNCSSMESRVIDSYVSRIRSAINDAGGRGGCIINSRGVGYRLEV